MITSFFIPELNNHDVQELWIQQDGATCHTARATIDLLKDTFGDRLISRFGLVNWPPRSCDLTPLDYFLWGYVKSLVYADKPQTLDHLEDNIRRVIDDIRPQMLEKVIENWTSRLDYIRASRGSHMPEIIFKILDDLFKEFERLDSNLSLEESELQEFEERYFYLNAKFNDKLDELNVQNQGRTQNSVASSITSNSNVSNFRLPKLSIPQFNGHFKDWINFKDLFVSTVHSQVSISNVEKFQYLKGLLTNEPASLIKHMPISNDSYEEAWQKLLDRYDNKKQIVQSLIKTFLDQKPISEANCFNLRKLLDTSDECLRGA
ncbi:uncharacterized protein TNCV_3763661 [Trichonephila clavipes]|uniref:Transposase n=1 Tax=Trichonephila clavipes TaxID=2585209 RepID=A0A8X6VVE3_TRICX|nr:uncharacterized protein TNCV_3763661 [Trichonephila clavipes]